MLVPNVFFLPPDLRFVKHSCPLPTSFKYYYIIKNTNFICAKLSPVVLLVVDRYHHHEDGVNGTISSEIVQALGFIFIWNWKHALGTFATTIEIVNYLWYA